eukprot:8895792-Alexandrium_andersonii.AAC.1
MSASLVGSEMCIRDRGGTGLLHQGEAPVPRPVPSCRREEAPPGGEHPHHCLLYTSDAADDM